MKNIFVYLITNGIRGSIISVTLFLMCFTLLGCDSMPNDLYMKKAEISQKRNQLDAQENTALEKSDYKRLSNEYTKLKSEVEIYTKECNNRGINKNNDEVISEIEGKIKKFTELYENYNSNSKGSNAQSNEVTSSNSTVSTTICSICGRQFTGSGYEEVVEGIWKPCSNPQYLCQVCSPSCGMRHTAKMNGILNQLNIKNHSNDGRVYEKDVCPLCKGTGIERPMNNLTNETGRICPMCDGRGVRSY